MSRALDPDRGTFTTVRAGLALTPEVYRGLWLTVTLALVAAAGRISVPVGIQYVIDNALVTTRPADPGRTVEIVVTTGLLAVLVAGLASWTLNRRLVRTSEHALDHLRRLTFAHILRIAPARLAGAPRGPLVSRVSADVDTVAEFTRTGGVTLLSNLGQMTAAAVVMAWYSWPLTLAVLLVGLLVVAVMRRVQRLVARRFALARVAVGDLYGSFGQVLRGAETVRAYGMDSYARRGTDRAVEAVRATQQHTQWPLHSNTALGELASGLLTAVVLVLGVYLGVGSHAGWLPPLSLGDLVAFLFLVTFFVRPLQFAVTILGEAQSAVAGWLRVLDILDTPTGEVAEADGVRPVPGPRRGPGSPPRTRPAGARGLEVELTGVGFGYLPGRPALTDVTLTIPAGGHVALVGETGSGKTTLAKLLTRQLVPDDGCIRLGGVPLRLVADAALVRTVAVVPQEAFLFDRTVGENIRLGRPDATEADVRAVLADLGLTGWAEALPDGLDTRAGQRGEALSAGERQLVALARTALVDPDLLVLDEATSGVDPATDVRVQAALDRLTRGRTTVTVAHRLFAAELADEVVVLHAGRVVERGPHAELLAAGGRYARQHTAWAGGAPLEETS